MIARAMGAFGLAVGWLGCYSNHVAEMLGYLVGQGVLVTWGWGCRLAQSSGCCLVANWKVKLVDTNAYLLPTKIMVLALLAHSLWSLPETQQS